MEIDRAYNPKKEQNGYLSQDVFSVFEHEDTTMNLDHREAC